MSENEIRRIEILDSISSDFSILGQRKRDEKGPIQNESSKKTASDESFAITLSANDTAKDSVQFLTGVISSIPRHQAMIKLLCPAELAGSLIGKAGAVISSLNQLSGANIKVSQNGELYPQTNDRVVYYHF